MLETSFHNNQNKPRLWIYIYIENFLFDFDLSYKILLVSSCQIQTKKHTNGLPKLFIMVLLKFQELNK